MAMAKLDKVSLTHSCAHSVPIALRELVIRFLAQMEPGPLELEWTRRRNAFPAFVADSVGSQR